MFRKRHLPAVVAAACLLLTAAACNGEPDGQTSTTPTSTPPSTPTPTPTKPSVAPPTMPPAAQNGLTVTSAEAFARFYVAAIDYAESTGDPRLMRQWQENGCENCRSIADAYEKSYREGGSITGQSTTKIVATAEARLVKSDTAVVVFRTMTGRATWRKTAQATPINLPGGAATWELTLAASKGRWIMFEVIIKK